MEIDTWEEEAFIQRENWGTLPYGEALEKQRAYVGEIERGVRGESIIFCSHFPVVTLGKKSNPDEDLVGWKGEVYQVERGGRATYHGLGQMLCYPLLNLKLRGQKLGEFLGALENATIETLGVWGVEAEGNTSRGNPKLTGVWEKASGRKLASIGVALKNWITLHGLAINLDWDPLAFTGIRPCGYSSQVMVSLEEVIGSKVDRKEFENHFHQTLLTLLPRAT